MTELVAIYSHEVHGYEGAVYVQSDGSVRVGPEGAPPWKCRTVRQRPNNRGYLMVNLKDANGVWRTPLVSRLVCEAFHGEPPAPSYHAHHRSGDKRDNRAQNLAWKEPRRHKSEHVGGLNELQVRLARELYSHGNITQAEIAAMLGTTARAISRAVTGDAWRNIPGPVTRPGREASKNVGSANGRAHYTEAQVREIRRRHKDGERISDIARDMGTARSAVSDVVHRRTWKHLPE